MGVFSETPCANLTLNLVVEFRELPGCVSENHPTEIDFWPFSSYSAETQTGTNAGPHFRYSTAAGTMSLVSLTCDQTAVDADGKCLCSAVFSVADVPLYLCWETGGPLVVGKVVLKMLFSHPGEAIGFVSNWNTSLNGYVTIPDSFRLCENYAPFALLEKENALWVPDEDEAAIVVLRDAAIPAGCCDCPEPENCVPLVVRIDWSATCWSDQTRPTEPYGLRIVYTNDQTGESQTVDLSVTDIRVNSRTGSVIAGYENTGICVPCKSGSGETFRNCTVKAVMFGGMAVSRTKSLVNHHCEEGVALIVFDDYALLERQVNVGIDSVCACGTLADVRANIGRYFPGLSLNSKLAVVDRQANTDAVTDGFFTLGCALTGSCYAYLGYCGKAGITGPLGIVVVETDNGVVATKYHSPPFDYNFSGGGIEIFPNVPVRIVLPLFRCDEQRTPYKSADEVCEGEMPEMKAVIPLGGQDTVELSFELEALDNGTMAYVAEGVVPCDTELAGETPSVVVVGGGSEALQDTFREYNVAEFECRSTGYELATGSYLVPKRSQYDLVLEADFRPVIAAGCVDDLYDITIDLYESGVFGSNRQWIFQWKGSWSQEPIEEVCGPDPFCLSSTGMIATVRSDAGSYKLVERLYFDADANKLTVRYEVWCDSFDFGEIRVKLNGGTVENPAIGWVVGDEYVVSAPVGAVLAAPTFSAPLACFSARNKYGASFPSTMQSGKTELELEWTAQVAVTVASVDGDWPYGSGGVYCPVGEDEREVVVSSQLPADSHFFEQAKNRAIPGTIAGGAVEFAYNATEHAWKYAGLLVLAQAPATQLDWTFFGGTFGSTASPESWVVKELRQIVYGTFEEQGVQDERIVRRGYFGAEVATIEATSGSLVCSSGSLVGSGSAQIDMTADVRGCVEEEDEEEESGS